jgi:hypothetical protein
VEIPPPQCPSFPFIPLIPKQALKDLATGRPLLRCDSTRPLYTLRLPGSATSTSPSSSSSAAFAVTPSSTTWHRRLGHPGRDILAQISHSADISCTRTTTKHLCQACQLLLLLHFTFVFFVSCFCRDTVLHHLAPPTQSPWPRCFGSD